MVPGRPADTGAMNATKRITIALTAAAVLAGPAAADAHAGRSRPAAAAGAKWAAVAHTSKRRCYARRWHPHRPVRVKVRVKCGATGRATAVTLPRPYFRG